jgi:hypothetical protein
MNRSIDTSLFSRYSPKYVEKFLEFHHENPEIYEEFVRMAKEARKYQKQYSAGAILEVMRWHRLTKGNGDVIKIRNEYRSLYARLLAQEQPEQFKEFFAFRSDYKRTGSKRV